MIDKYKFAIDQSGIGITGNNSSNMLYYAIVDNVASQWVGTFYGNCVFFIMFCINVIMYLLLSGI